MSTHHQLFQESIVRWASEADRLAAHGFELSQARELILTIGARTEIFMKTAVLPNTPPKQDFDGCINGLKTLGVSKSDRDTLHVLRTLYNSIKHDPLCVPSLLELQGVIPRVSDVFRRLAQTNVGLLNAEISVSHHQIFWIAVWDHFIGGDSEVHVIAPTRSGWPPDLDLVYVDISSWDQIKTILSTLGTLKPGRDLIPQQVQKSFMEDYDFHEAIVFEGAFRDLIAVLATYERREDLLPGLRREDDLPAMVQAFVLASMDVASQAPHQHSIEGLTAAISNRAIEAYAVPVGYRLIQSQSRDFAELLQMLPEDKRGQLNGPVWIGKEEFRNVAPHAMSKHPKLPVLISKESTVLLLFPSESENGTNV
jgi:hypothetical protein